MWGLKTTIVLVALGAAACNDRKTLDRARASAIIRDTLHFPIAKRDAAWFGHVAVARQPAGELAATIKLRHPTDLDWNNYTALISAGLVTSQDTGEFPMGWSGFVGFFDLEPTDRLRPDLGPETVQGRVRTTSVRVFDWQFGEVTGIRFVAGNTTASVEYTVRRGNFSHAAEAMSLTQQRTENRVAQFVLYDDGWRLTQ